MSASRAALIVSAMLCAVFCALAADRTWPLIDGDGTAYFPAAVEWSLSRPLTNPVWLPPLDDSIDGPGGRRLTYHGFLYQLLIGSLARPWGGGPEATVAAAYVVHWLAAVTSAVAVFVWADVSGRRRLWLAGLLPPAMLALSIAWHGRVESLAMLLVGAAAIAWRRQTGSARDVIAGSAVVLLAVTSPACGALGLCALGAALAGSFGSSSALRSRLAAVAVGVAVASVGVTLLYPYPIADWFAGVARHAQINQRLPRGSGFVQAWVTASQLPLLIVSLVLLLGAAASRLRTIGAQLTRPWRLALGASSVCFAFGLVQVALVKSEAAYNAVVWIPLLACLASAGRPSDVRVTLLVAAMVLPALGLGRSAVVLARQFDARAVTFAEVRDAIRALPRAEVAVSSGLWLAADDPASMTVTGVDAPRGRRFIRQETYTGRAEPPAYPGYDLGLSRFRPGLSAFRLPIARTAGGWEFAVYEQQ